MTAVAPNRATPGTAVAQRLARRERFLTGDHQRIPQRLVRLRVATAPQLERLCTPLAGRARSVVHQRLRRMVLHGLLQTGLVRPSRGAYSSVYYQAAHAGLVALGREAEKHLLRRPRQHILEYLVFRAEVYATVRHAGWHIGSPVLTPRADQQRYLALFRRWAKQDRERYHAELCQRRGTPQSVLMAARQDAERVEKFAPRELTFEFILKVNDAREPVGLALLVLDDPRRSVRAQLSQLPGELHPGMRIILRDHRTRYYTLTGRTYLDNPRLRQWKLALARRYTTEPAAAEELFARELRDPLFPDLWAVRTAAPTIPHHERRQRDSLQAQLHRDPGGRSVSDGPGDDHIDDVVINVRNDQ